MITGRLWRFDDAAACVVDALVGVIGENTFPLTFVFDPGMILLTLFFALALSGAASLLPALGAARVRISTTIRYG